MANNNPALATISRDIESTLKKEISVHERYITALREQRQFITKFQIKKLEELDAKRIAMIAEMQTLNEKRIALSKRFPEHQGKRLSTLVEVNLPKEDARRNTLLIDMLRDLLGRERALSVESNQVLKFAINLVHGSMSLLSQASQSIVRRYSRSGDLKESVTPNHSRKERVLKEA